MRIFLATFPTPGDFLRRLARSSDGEKIFLRVATKARFPEGEEMIVELDYPGLPNRVLIRALALGEEKGGDEQWFCFCSGEEHKRDFLIAVAAGETKASWRRRHRRFPIRMPARFVVEGSDVPVRGDAETEDMGSGGVALKTSRAVPDGAAIRVLLEPGNGWQNIEFSGRVVWSQGNGIGVQFAGVSGEPMKQLRRMIRGVKGSGRTLETVANAA